MMVSDVLTNLSAYDDDLTIYAVTDPEWTACSEAIVARELDDGSIPQEAAGLQYFIEVYLAKDVLRVWSDWRAGTTPTAEQACEAVIYYAVNDAYLPV